MIPRRVMVRMAPVAFVRLLNTLLCVATPPLSSCGKLLNKKLSDVYSNVTFHGHEFLEGGGHCLQNFKYAKCCVSQISFIVQCFGQLLQVMVCPMLWDRCPVCL